MKKIILSVTCISLTLWVNAQSPSLTWAKSMGGASHNDYGHSIAVDAAGNVYTMGDFTGTADFDPGAGTYNLTSAGPLDIFISKLDASGNFVWAKRIGGSAQICYIYGASVALDANGNVYYTGFFRDTIDFDPGPGTFNLVSDDIQNFIINIFVAKLDASGNFAWAKKMAGTFVSAAMCNTVDQAGNSFTSGYFTGTVDFDPGPGTYNLTASNHDVFILKLDPAGNFVWAKKFGGSDTADGYGIALDASGNVYTTGIFHGTVDFDPGAGTYNLIRNGNADIFISKLDPSGNFAWAKNIGGVPDDYGRAIKTDAAGNVYVTGNFGGGTVDFDPGPGIFNLTDPGGASAFIIKLNTSGDFVWAKNIVGLGDYITLDGASNIYIFGSFSGTADFDPNAGTFFLTSTGGENQYILKLTNTGNFVWAINLQIRVNGEISTRMAVDANNNVYSTGFYSGTVDFDPGTGVYNLTTTGGFDILVHKMSQQCSPPSATITPSGSTTFCSGGSVVLNAPVAANRSYQWKKGGNDISGATSSSYTATTGGTYKVTVINTNTGCSKTTVNGTVVTVNALPAATITPQGPTTFCAGGSVVLQANTGAGLTYKWKKGGNNITGATMSNYTATSGGVYKTEVTKNNGCSKTSSGVTITIPCRENKTAVSSNNFDFSVYPNPSTGAFTIKFSAKPISPVRLEMVDAIGKIVEKFESNEQTVEITKLNLSKGIYCLIARNGTEVVLKKINIAR